ncbi:hypothetical protein Taro_004574 [Colocasia esculenta]|uniref:FAR1 domain-containing protein n=1 Tax=Colocasia esculenta TaxID=4460 RepID=A0A843TKH6_COLES|nr:hypothetical protein [Colocasia esculenta]
MLESESESAQLHIRLEDDRMAVRVAEAVVKTSLNVDNQLVEAPVKGESILTQCEAGLEPYEGMEFESEEAARIFYNTYSRRLGFCIRISKYSRSRCDNSVISRKIVCSKEGFREVRPKKGMFSERRQRQRVVTRVGCKAMIMVKKLSSGRWIVSKFVKEHNHGPIPPKNLEVRVARDVDPMIEKSISYDDDSSIQELFEGMEFDSEEAAKTFYNAYARCMGFRARISKYCRSRRDNSIISRRLVCSKEGFREVRVKKKIYDEGKTKRTRAITRIGCKAMITVKRVSSGKWVVSKFEKEHNHALVTSKKVLHLQPYNYDERSSVSILQQSGKVQSGLIADRCNPGVQRTLGGSLNVLYTQLCNEAIRYAQEGATTEDSYNVAMAALKEAVDKVAAAKRNIVVSAQKTNPVIVPDQRHSCNISFQTNLHDSSSSNELKQGVPSQEIVLLQQHVNLVLIPSGFTSDLADQNQPARTPFIISTPNSQKQQVATAPVEKLTGNRSLVSSSSSRRKRKLEVTRGSKGSGGDAQKSQKMGSGSNLIGAGPSEAQLIAIPALPVALYMPVIGVATPGASGNYAFLATPIGAIPLSSHPGEASTPSPHSSFPSGAFANESLKLAASVVNSSTANNLYTGPNPEVHAAAVAAGARIVHPSAAASLIKAVEARIRSGAGSLVKSTFIDGAKPLAIKPPVTAALDVQTGSRQ